MLVWKTIKGNQVDLYYKLVDFRALIGVFTTFGIRAVTSQGQIVRRRKRFKIWQLKILVEIRIPAAAKGVELTEAQQKTIADQKLKDLKVKNYLFQAIDRTIMKMILNRVTAKNKKK